MYTLTITGDIHYPTTSAHQIREMTSDIRSHSPNAIALIGDVAEVYQGIGKFEDCLQIFRKELPNIPILVLPGNHDLWVNEHETNFDSRKLFDELLPKVTRDAGCFWLETENYVAGEVALIGSYLHYNYTAKDKTGPISLLPDKWFEQNKSSILNDRFMIGLPRDIDFAKELGDAFESRLRDAQENESIRKIVVMSHVPCMEEQITRNPRDYNWSIATPYFGNLSHHQFILGLDKIRFVVSAHSHRGSRTSRNIGNRHLEIINLSADYRKPKFITIEV